MMKSITVYSSAESGRVEVVSPPVEESIATPALYESGRAGTQRPAAERVSSEKGVVANRERSEPVLHITLAQLSEAIASALRSVKVYVVESEITEAQRAVRAVVEESHF